MKPRRYRSKKWNTKDERLKEPRMGMYKRNATYRHKELEWNRSGDVSDNDFKPLVDQIFKLEKVNRD